MTKKTYGIINPNSLGFFDKQMQTLTDSFLDVFLEDFLSDRNRIKSLITDDSKYPKTNISNDKENINIEMAVPGLTANDINIEIKDQGILTVFGSKQEQNEIDKNSSLINEIKKSSFVRSFNLSAIDINIDEEKEIETILQNGILNIKIPLKNKEKINNKNIRKLEIKTE